MYDLLYERYANPQFFFDMDIEEGIEMINHIYEKKREDKAYQLYTASYQNMTEESYITFEEFYRPQKKQEVAEVKSAEEILKDVREMMDSHSVN